VGRKERRVRAGWCFIGLLCLGAAAAAPAGRGQAGEAAARPELYLGLGHAQPITSPAWLDKQTLAWSPDGRTLATGSADGSVRLWSAATGREVAAFYALDQGQEWLTVTPQGYFTASPGGAEVIQWRLGGKLWSLARFRRRFEPPERVRRALAGQRYAGHGKKAGLRERLLPQPGPPASASPVAQSPSREAWAAAIRRWGSSPAAA
jgi:hypothetical protein